MQFIGGVSLTCLTPGPVPGSSVQGSWKFKNISMGGIEKCYQSQTFYSHNCYAFAIFFSLIHNQIEPHHFISSTAVACQLRWDLKFPQKSTRCRCSACFMSLQREQLNGSSIQRATAAGCAPCAPPRSTLLTLAFILHLSFLQNFILDVVNTA